MGPRAHRSDLEMGVGQFIHWHQEEKPSTEADELGEVLEGDEIIFFCSVLVFSKVWKWGVVRGYCRLSRQERCERVISESGRGDWPRLEKHSCFLSSLWECPGGKKDWGWNKGDTRGQRDRDRLSWREGDWEYSKVSKWGTQGKLRHRERQAFSSSCLEPSLHFLPSTGFISVPLALLPKVVGTREGSKSRLEAAMSMQLEQAGSLCPEGWAIESPAWSRSHQKALCNPLPEDLWGEIQKGQVFAKLYLIWWGGGMPSILLT